MSVFFSNSAAAYFICTPAYVPASLPACPSAWHPRSYAFPVAALWLGHPSSSSISLCSHETHLLSPCLWVPPCYLQTSKSHCPVSCTTFLSIHLPSTICLLLSAPAHQLLTNQLTLVAPPPETRESAYSRISMSGVSAHGNSVILGKSPALLELEYPSLLSVTILHSDFP